MSIREGDRVEFTRTTVGRHLLLGGDNLDLTLSWLAESKLGKTLSLRQRSALRRQCSAAKERAFRRRPPERRDHGIGARFIPHRRHAEDSHHPRRGTRTRPRRISSALQADRQAAAGKAKRLSRAWAALRLRSCHHAAPRRVLAEFTRRGARHRRHPIQRRLLHPASLSRARARRRRALVRPQPAGVRKSGSRSRRCHRRRLLFLCPLNRKRRAGSRRFASRLLPRPAGCQPASRSVCLVPRGAEEGQEIGSTKPNSSFWRNSSSRSVCTVRFSRTEDKPGDDCRLPRTCRHDRRCRRAPPCTPRSRGDSFRKGRRTAHSGHAWSLA